MPNINEFILAQAMCLVNLDVLLRSLRQLALKGQKCVEVAAKGNEPSAHDLENQLELTQNVVETLVKRFVEKIMALMTVERTATELRAAVAANSSKTELVAKTSELSVTQAEFDTAASGEGNLVSWVSEVSATPTESKKATAKRADFFAKIFEVSATPAESDAATPNEDNLVAKTADVSVTQAASHAAIPLTNGALSANGGTAICKDPVLKNEKASPVVYDKPCMEIPPYAQPNDILNVEIFGIDYINLYVGRIQKEAEYRDYAFEEISAAQMLKEPPVVSQVLLCKYNVDHCWYRAICLRTIPDVLMYEVMYVDFGNKDIAYIHELAHPHAESMQLPFLVMSFHFPMIKEIPNEDNANLIELHDRFANGLIMNKIHKLKYVTQFADGNVCLEPVDDDLKAYLKILAEMKLVEVVEE